MEFTRVNKVYSVESEGPQELLFLDTWILGYTNTRCDNVLGNSPQRSCYGIYCSRFFLQNFPIL